MSNNDYILKAVKGEPGSLTSTAFNTGVIVERERIIKLLDELDDEEWMGINQNFIALIKGENK